MESVHIQSDFSREPKELKNPDTGVSGGFTYPSKTYAKGDIVWHYDDLENDPKLVNKFQREDDRVHQFQLSTEPPPMETPKGMTVPPSFDDVPVLPSGPATAPQAAASPTPAKPTPNAPQGQQGPPLTQQPKRQLPSNLHQMTVAQLKRYAQEEEISLEGVTSREDILAVIKGDAA